MKQEKLTTSLLGIGIPILAGMAVTQVQQITDQAFLGNAAPEYLSAVGNAGFTIWTTMSFLFALGTGTAILVAQKLGEEKPEEAESILGSTFVFSSFFSVLLFAIWFFGNRTIFHLMGLEEPILTYAALYAKIYTVGLLFSGINTAAMAVYNGSGFTRPLMLASILRAGINIFLDWVLIFGKFGFPAMGIAGAAIATLTAEIIGAAYTVTAAFSRKLPVYLSFTAIKQAKLGVYLRVIRIGIPASLEEFSWNIGNIVLIRFLNEIDPLAAGIYTIVASITIVPALFFMAMGSATMTLSGRRTGEGRPAEIRRTGQTAMLMCWGVSTIFFALFVVFPESFAGVFTRDPSVIAQTGAMLLVNSFALFPRSANIVFGGGIRGMGDTRWMLFTQIFGTIFVLIFARVLMFSLSLAILGLFLAVFLDETTRAVMNGRHFYSSVRRKSASRALSEGETAVSDRL